MEIRETSVVVGARRQVNERRKQVRRARGRITDWSRVERFLIPLLLFTPLILWWADETRDGLRSSISAYHNLSAAQWFYVPLTVVAMLFVVNGVLKKREKHGYNVWLGVALSGVILFDEDRFTGLHILSAGTFFLGNIFVVLFLSKFSESLKRRVVIFKLAILAGIGLAVLGLFIVDGFTVLHAEWLSMGMIAIHFMLDSFTEGYNAAAPADGAQLRFWKQRSDGSTSPAGSASLATT